MGNCWIFKKCKWPLRTRDDAKYQFDPDKDIRIEPKRPEEMREVSNFYEDTFDIDLVERTSLENKNCTQIDDVLREIKDQKEMVNNNIKLEMKAKGADDDNNEINFGPEDLSFIGSTPLHDIVEEDEAIGSGLKSLNESSLSSMVNLDLEDLDNDKLSIDNEPDVIKNTSNSKLVMEDTISVVSSDLDMINTVQAKNQKNGLSFEEEVYEELENKLKPQFSVTGTDSNDDTPDYDDEDEDEDIKRGALSVELSPEKLKSYRSSFHTIINVPSK